MSFCTVINCMDGRTQLPVNEFLREKFQVDYVDTITEAGPIRILSSEDKDSFLLKSILRRVDISINKHQSTAIALVIHYDCAGNPAVKAEKLLQLQTATKLLKEKYPETEILGLWVDSEWKVEHIENKS